MSTIVNQRTSRTHSNSISAESAPISERLDAIRAGSSMARMDANPLETRRPLRELAVDVLREMGISQKAAAINAGCAESDLCNALKGRQRLEIEWLHSQGPAFWQELSRRVEAADGHTAEAQDQIDAENIARLFEVVVRMTLRRRRAEGA